MSDGNLFCPFCGWWGVHFNGVPAMTENVRGRVLTVSLKCEKGHIFDVSMESHAGNMTAEATETGFNGTWFEGGGWQGEVP